MNKFHLSEQQLQKYHDQGFLFLDFKFSANELSVLKKATRELMRKNFESHFRDKVTKHTLSIRGLHFYSPVFKKLCSHPALFFPAQQILNSLIYIYQSKLNKKNAFDGPSWEWHQDLVSWIKDDGIVDSPVNAIIFLEDTSEFNAPLFFIPKSHQLGPIEVISPEGKFIGKKLANGRLQYPADLQLVKKLAKKNGLYSAKGKAGSILFFHPCIFHCSTNNMSPFGRAIILITYNKVTNIINRSPENRRPIYMASFDYTPLEVAEENCLML